MIKNIVFDIGMVLVDFHWEKTMASLGIPDEVIKHFGPNMINHPLWHEMDLNIMPEDDIRAELKKLNPQYSNYVDLFFDNCDEVITSYEGDESLMIELKKMGYKIYLLSNYPERMFRMHKKRYTFYPYVDGEVVSYQCHLTKPDPAIYKLLCSRYRLIPEECIFLDDRKENIDAAKALGFSGIVVDNPHNIRNELLSFLNNR